MPTVEDHKEEALKELKLLAQPSTQPELKDTELESIIDGVQRASFWVASTTFEIGAVVLPATKTGHCYVCVQSGSTSTTEPTWPTRDGAVVIDGSVTWQEAGPAFDNVFDIRAAAEQAWSLKAAKASVLIDNGDAKYSQIAENCREMAKSYSPILIA